MKKVTYQERVEILAGRWGYTFRHTKMCSIEHMAFRCDCLEFDVKATDVFLEMATK